MSLAAKPGPLLLTVLLVTAAGCGFITGSEPLAFSAAPATVSEAALSETGYEHANTTEDVVTREFSAADQTRTVKVTNQIARYERQIELPVIGSQRAAVFVAFSSPEVSVAGQNFNPIADMNSQELLDRFESSYESLSVGEQVGSSTTVMLGEPVTVRKYEGSAQLAGQEVPVYIHLTDVVNDGEDYVVSIAVYPQQLSGEEDSVMRLIEGVQH